LHLPLTLPLHPSLGACTTNHHHLTPPHTPTQDTKAAKEVRALQDFMAMLGSDPARAYYGPAHVWAAHEMGAVQVRQ
jgi:hypothetical protein